MKLRLKLRPRDMLAFKMGKKSVFFYFLWAWHENSINFFLSNWVPPRIKFSAACQVCQSTERTRLYFGITSCAACAAFFRRSDGIQYMCTANNSCTIAYGRSLPACLPSCLPTYQILLSDIKFFCRACRYESCVRAGMRRDSEFLVWNLKFWFQNFFRCPET